MLVSFHFASKILVYLNFSNYLINEIHRTGYFKSWRDDLTVATIQFFPTFAHLQTSVHVG